MTFEYSEDGDLAAGHSTRNASPRYRYDSHLLVQETDRDGVTFWFEYDGRDASASCVRTWGSDGQGSDRLFFRELTYDKKNMVTMVEDSFGHVTTYRMNVLNAVVEILDPHGASTKFAYTDELWPSEEIDALGHITRREYDARGNEVKRVLPNGATFTVSYDREDRIVAMVDPLGRHSSWIYVHPSRPEDLLSKPITSRTPSGVAQYEYDGRERTTIRTNGLVFVLDFDRFGQLRKLTFTDGTYEERWYDRQGRLVKTRDSAGRVRRLSYDWQSRVIEIVEPGGLVRHAAYSPEGDIVAYRDATRFVTYGYSGSHKIAWRSEGGVQTQYRYTSEDDLVAVVNEEGELYSFTRDACRHVIEEVGFDGRRRIYERNAVGAPTTVFLPSKRAQHFTYDALGAVTLVRYSDATETRFVYDLLGQLEGATNGSGTLRWERDASGRTLKESFNEAWVASTYDGSGRRVGVTTSLGLVQSIARDPKGQVQAVHLWDPLDPRRASPTWGISFERDSLGYELRRTMVGGATSTCSRSEAGLPLSSAVTRGPQVLSETRYTWEGDNLLTSTHRAGLGSTAYEHDARNRLTGSIGPDGTTLWRSPSPAGHLFRTKARTDRRYGRGGVLLEAEEVNFSYDSDGNLSRTTAQDGSTRSYEWNADGTLASVALSDGATVRFAYDALHRRVAKSVSGVTTRWLWDGDVPVHEEQDNGTQTATTTWLFEPGRLAPLGKVAPDGQKYSIITDYLGTPTEMLDEAGTLAWKAQLDIYGVAHVDLGQPQECPWRQLGQYDDSETGLYYNRFRYYDPVRGDYLSQDPLRLRGGRAAYAYVSDPLRSVDPLGLAACKPDVSTEPDTAFFWSGRTEGVGGEIVAADIARARGGTTLEMLIQERGIILPKWDDTKPEVVAAWTDVSERYAQGVSGEVRAVIGSEVRPAAVWHTELVALQNNPAVTSITTIDPKTLKETTILQR